MLAGAPFAGAAAPRVEAWLRERAAPAALDGPALVGLTDAPWPALFATMNGPRPVATVTFTVQFLADPSELAAGEAFRYTGHVETLREGFFVEHRALMQGGRRVTTNQQTFALLGYVALRLAETRAPTPAQRRLRPMIVAALALLALQLALGGWTSANYAALACGADFPKCYGQWWPPTDFHQGFVLWRGIGVNYEGGVLDAPARAAIQIAHRIGALVVSGFLLATAARAWRRGLRAAGALLAVLLCTQVALGIANVKLMLPLPVATAHNGGAALLLLCLVALLVRVQSPLTPAQRA